METVKDLVFIRQAIELAFQNVENQDGMDGPFGAVIVKDDEVIATGVDLFTSTHNLFAHAEVVALKNAQNKLGTKDLKGCVIYSSCKPCEMCLSVLSCANIKKIYYAADQEDAKRSGFKYPVNYVNLDKSAEMGGKRELPMQQVLNPNKLMPFIMWTMRENKNRYSSK